MKHSQRRLRTLQQFVALSAIIAGSGTTNLACSDQPDKPATETSARSPVDVDASVAAWPIVQSAGVQRIRFRAADKVTSVDLLDDADQQIGTLVLETTVEQQVHALQTLRGHTLEATWTAKELSFTQDSGAPVIVRAGEKPSEELDQALDGAGDLLTVATFVAAQVGVYSPVGAESGMLAPKEFASGAGGSSGTGCSNYYTYTGTSSTWRNGWQALWECQKAAAKAAFDTCAKIEGTNRCYPSTHTTQTTAVENGYYTGYTCTSTIRVGHNCAPQCDESKSGPGFADECGGGTGGAGGAGGSGGGPVDACADVTCPPGTACSDGLCVAVDSCAGVVCPTGSACSNGLCQPIDLCANVHCGIGQSCVAGQCVSSGCTSDFDCPPGQECWGYASGAGYCAPAGVTCVLDGFCASGETCSCDPACCSGPGGPGPSTGTGPGGTCGYDGGPTISYGDCYACGGMVIWADGNYVCEGHAAQ